jgi:predicted deacylase
LLEIIRTMADFLIDFHGASKLNEICRFAGVANMGNSSDQYSFDVARRTGVDYILLDGNNQDKNNRDRLTVALSEYGIPAIVFENGGGLSWTEEAVRRHIYSARQVMYEAGFLKKGQSAACTGQPFVADQYVYFDIEGLLLEYLPLGTEVNKGDVCLKVLNVVTMGVQEVVSPCDGCFVFCIHNAAVVKRGDLACA